MSDIVERLRDKHCCDNGCHCDDAANEITTLRAEVEKLRAEVQTWQGHAKTAVWSDSEECKMLTADNERLRAALEPFAKAADGFDTQRIKNPEEWFAYGGVSSNSGTVGAITVGDLRRARAALKEEKKG